jgi:hypothetical protein
MFLVFGVRIKCLRQLSQGNSMSIICVKAHFDGTTIQLDEPIVLAQNTPLLVTILPVSPENSFGADWAQVSHQALSRAFSDNEPEYSSTDLIP